MTLPLTETPLMLRIGALMVFISGENMAVEFLSRQIEGNRFFIHSTYVHFGIFSSLITI